MATPGATVGSGALITPGGAQGPQGATGPAGSGSGDMLKSVYDTNGDNLVDAAAAAPWTGITGRPSTFPPSAHASTHQSGGADALALDTLATPTDITTLNASTGAHGLLRKLSGTGTQYLDGSGAWSTPPTNTGPPGPAGANSWTLTTADFTVPAIGSTVAVNVSDTSWAVVGEYVWVATAGGSANAPMALQITAKTGTSVTLLNPPTAGTSPSGDANNLLSVGSDSLLYLPPTALNPINAFITKTSAYTLTVTDSGKFVICSGGSWTLTLPSPLSGLLYRLRNDQGITGTTGTITLQPGGGRTIDGQSSLALLPAQECTLITDGSNWRTHGLKREVILGILDIASATASASVLLPVGYRFYELAFENISGSADGTWLQFLLSSDGGSTWKTDSAYSLSTILNNAATTVVNSTVQTTAANASPAGSWVTNTGASGASYVKFWPGDGTLKIPHWKIESHAWNNAVSTIQTYLNAGRYMTSPAIINAIQYKMSSGNMVTNQLTVKGVI